MTISVTFIALAFQSSAVSFLRNPIAFLQTLNWPQVVVAAVIILGLWALLAKLLKKLFSAKKTAAVGFAGNENAFRAVFDDSLVGAVLLDKEGRILHANRALGKII